MLSQLINNPSSAADFGPNVPREGAQQDIGHSQPAIALPTNLSGSTAVATDPPMFSPEKGQSVAVETWYIADTTTSHVTRLHQEAAAATSHAWRKQQEADAATSHAVRKRQEAAAATFHAVRKQQEADDAMSDALVREKKARFHENEAARLWRVDIPSDAPYETQATAEQNPQVPMGERVGQALAGASGNATEGSPIEGHPTRLELLPDAEC
jgi:hypothetical protein